MKYEITMNELQTPYRKVTKIIDAYNKEMAKTIALYKVHEQYGGKYWGFVSIKRLKG